MRTSKLIHLISCHAEGEVGDVIVGGVPAPRGQTLWEQSRFIAKDGALRSFVLNEPRGGVFRHVNLLVPAKDPRAQMGFIIMEPEEYAADVELGLDLRRDRAARRRHPADAGRPERMLRFEAPGGLIAVVAECRNGKAERISVENVPPITDRLEDAPLEVGAGRAHRRHRPMAATALRDRRRGGAGLRGSTQDEARDLAGTGTANHHSGR